MPPAAAVVFDLGNVLIRWDPHPAVAAGVGDAEARAFLAAEDFDFSAWNRRADAGASFRGTTTPAAFQKISQQTSGLRPKRPLLIVAPGGG